MAGKIVNFLNTFCIVLIVADVILLSVSDVFKFTISQGFLKVLGLIALICLPVVIVTAFIKSKNRKEE